MPMIVIKDNPFSQFQKKTILDTNGICWIAKVKPHQEKAFAFALLEHEIEYDLPYYSEVTKRSDGKSRKSTLTLFSSYL